ncbi:hypothetical protein PVK06_011252 [Gossypium arboreum]|uniref:Zinc knuckle CX2CX4HX4C domain-containing protein n=1 Tax=Gossypium arboreum TaxID=29729 RepID=A0ABR0Q8G6_GOSAR|nr:hypothetical protein PVK06_011252 [Gossypium arboreum]
MFGMEKKSYNPDGFRAQVRSIWKMKRKFEIHTAGQNLFQISFEDEDNIKEELCRIQILLDARKPLQKGIFIAIGITRKVWLPFKYESLPNFCISCGIMGHIEKDYDTVMKQRKVLEAGELPYTVALKAESNLVGRESLKLGMADKKFTKQHLYIEDENERIPPLASLLKDEVTRAKEEMENKIQVELHAKKLNEEEKTITAQQNVIVRESDIGQKHSTEYIGRQKIMAVRTNANTTEIGRGE